MAITKTAAIVLKTDNYRNTSKIVTFFSSDFGKLKCIAKGVRDVKSKWGGVLMPLSHLNIIFYYKENKTLHLLSNAEYILTYKELFNDYDKLQAGFKAIELVNMISETQHPNLKVFELLCSFLKYLNSEKIDLDVLLIYFEYRLSEYSGFHINLSSFKILKDNINQYFIYTYLNGSLKNDNQLFSKFQLTFHTIELLKKLNNWNFNKDFDFIISKREIKVLKDFMDEYILFHLDRVEQFKTKKVFNKT